MNTGNAKVSSVLDFTRNLEQKGRVIAEYIWIDGSQ